MKMSRREFVIKTTALGLGLSLKPFVLSPPLSLAESKIKTSVAFVKGDRIKATKKAVELIGGMDRFVKKGDRVTLKPNMSFPHSPERATNTHPEVVAAIAEMCMDAGAKDVLVLDYPFNPPDPCLRLSGIRDACSEIKNVRTIVVSDERFFQTFPIKKGGVLKEVKLIKDVVVRDVLINIPTAKSHSATGVSLGMKGLMGIIWDRRYFHARVDLNQAIADLASAVKVDLTVIDASRSLTTAGPTGPGVVEYPNTVIAGTDPVAVDAAGVMVSKWYGQTFRPEQIKHIALAQDMGLGTLKMEEIKLLKAEA